MNGDLLSALERFVSETKEETVALIQALCRIPAPTGKERNRAEFCRNFLLLQGAEDVFLDNSCNMLFPFHCEADRPIVLFSAHTDTVFPDTEPMPYVDDGVYVHSPGVGDDTACLAVLLMAIKFLLQQNIKPKIGILFAANSGEEGLGNLKGIRQIFSDYGDRIREAYTFDGQYDAVVSRCVGSHRYEITLKTAGGHSFRDFGAENAIHSMAKLICRLYSLEIPPSSNSHTTYNIGLANGGTSVNTIAQEATFFYECRSDSAKCLQQMKTVFLDTVSQFSRECSAEIQVREVGYRPCGQSVPEDRLRAITRRVVRISKTHSGISCRITSGSTDCNIPMSLGIPAVCVGSYLGSGEHTREEKVRKDSLPIGLRIACELILNTALGEDGV